MLQGLSIVVLWTVLASASPADADTARSHPPAADIICPPAYGRTYEVVAKFLNDPVFVEARHGADLQESAGETPRLLTDSLDAEACRLLNATFGERGVTGEWRASYYRLGDRDLVSVQQIDPPGGMRVGWVPLFIFDLQLTYVAGYAM